MNAALAVIVGMLTILTLGLGGASPAEAAGPDDVEPARHQRAAVDSHSFGNPEQIRVYQVVLDLTVDFEHRVIEGSAILDFSRQPGCPSDAPLVLDSRGLTIERRRTAQDGTYARVIHSDALSARTRSTRSWARG